MDESKGDDFELDKNYTMKDKMKNIDNLKAKTGMKQYDF